MTEKQHRVIDGFWEGDLNDICRAGEKKGGRDRTESSYKGFKEFIERIEMVEVAFQGRQYTWANNWEDEGYIEARLDRFFEAARWWTENANATILHIEKQASDYSLLILDTNPQQGRKKS